MGAIHRARQRNDAQHVLEAHDDLLVKVRSEEGPRHLCSSPLAFGEIWALKCGVKPSTGDRARVQTASPQHEAKPAASRSSPPQGANREPSPVCVGEGQGRGEERGAAAPRNPTA